MYLIGENNQDDRHYTCGDNNFNESPEKDADRETSSFLIEHYHEKDEIYYHCGRGGKSDCFVLK